MKSQVIGIDISKDTLDFCQLDPKAMSPLSKGVLENTSATINEWLGKWHPDAVVFAVEHTGHYGALLLKCLCDKGFSLYMINPLDLKRSLGIQRGKTDAKDAYRIAEYLIKNHYKLKPCELPNGDLSRLKALVAARERYVKMSVQVQNSLKANQILTKSIDVGPLILEEKKLYGAIQRAIKETEGRMVTIIKSNIKFKTTYDKITSVIGVGPIIAAKCIVETQNFTRFEDPRKFSCHCGLAPFQYQSGSSVKGKTKTHFLRNRSMKVILIKGAITAIGHDPQLKAYYNRKIKEGKHPMSVKNAVANKIVLRIFAVVKRNEPYVKLAA